MKTVKECLKSLTEQNVDMAVNKHVKFLLENVEESQLLYKLSTNVGIKIDNNMLHLWYNPGIGFQCRNMWEDKYGKLPICGKIERFLNNEMSKS
jgi:hypothetical protein